MSFLIIQVAPLPFVQMFPLNFNALSFLKNRAHFIAGQRQLIILNASSPRLNNILKHLHINLHQHPINIAINKLQKLKIRIKINSKNPHPINPANLNKPLLKRIPHPNLHKLIILTILNNFEITLLVQFEDV
jgi:hypothetical protein